MTQSFFWKLLTLRYLKSYTNYTTKLKGSTKSTFNNETLNDLKLGPPLLSADHDGDVGEHEGVNHQHDQDRTCDAARRTFIFYILKITEHPNKLVHLTIEQTFATEVEIYKYDKRKDILNLLDTKLWFNGVARVFNGELD